MLCFMAFCSLKINKQNSGTQFVIYSSIITNSNLQNYAVAIWEITIVKLSHSVFNFYDKVEIQGRQTPLGGRQAS